MQLLFECFAWCHAWCHDKSTIHLQTDVQPSQDDIEISGIYLYSYKFLADSDLHWKYMLQLNCLPWHFQGYAPNPVKTNNTIENSSNAHGAISKLFILTNSGTVSTCLDSQATIVDLINETSVTLNNTLEDF